METRGEVMCSEGRDRDDAGTSQATAPEGWTTRGGQGKKEFCPRASGGRITLLTPSLLTSSLHDYEKIHFYLFGWLVLATMGKMWDLSFLIGLEPTTPALGAWSFNY